MTDKRRESIVVILSAPSGSGKTTIVSRLMESMDNISRSISYTTRPPRDGEKNGEDYIFVSREVFDKMRDNGEFLEWEENFGNFYGTSREQVEKLLDSGRDVVMSIDVKGARKAKKEFPESI
nr:guanylate kinase [Candidatus Omnitrophota bacterium]